MKYAAPVINLNPSLTLDSPNLVLASLVVGTCDICGQPIDNMKVGYRTAADGKTIWHPNEEAVAMAKGWTRPS